MKVKWDEWKTKYPRFSELGVFEHMGIGARGERLRFKSSKTRGIQTDKSNHEKEIQELMRQRDELVKKYSPYGTIIKHPNRIADLKAINQQLRNKVEFLKTIPLFQNLGLDVLSAFASLCTPCNFKKDEFIYHEGHKPEFIYIFKYGKIVYFTNTPSGKTITANISSTTTLCGITDLFTDDPYWLSAKAIENIDAFKVRRKDFIALLTKNPEIALNILGIMEQLLHSGFNRFKSAIATSAEQRVLDIIYDLYEKFGPSVPLSDEEIASLVGTTRETTVRAISRIKMKGIVKKYRGRLQILDHATLCKLKQEYPVI
jgi:CRP-like cAMP-binding protein